MKIICNIFLFLILLNNLSAQTEKEKWGKTETDYRINYHNEEIKNPEPKSYGEFFLHSVHSAYRFFISDVDGDNCPFQPSCSAFFVESVKETNIFQGSLMFFDRFTRDMNIFKKGNYPIIGGKFYDPVEQYTFTEEKNLLMPE